MVDPEFITAILHSSQFAQVAALELEASGDPTIEEDRGAVAVGRPR